MAGFHSKTFQKHDDYMTPKHAWEDIKDYIPKKVDGMSVPSDRCNFDCFYYCYKIGLPKDIVWID